MRCNATQCNAMQRNAMPVMCGHCTALHCAALEGVAGFDTDYEYWWKDAATSAGAGRAECAMGAAAYLIHSVLMDGTVG